MLIASGVEAIGGDCLSAFYLGAAIGSTESALAGKTDFDNGDVVLQADIV